MYDPAMSDGLAMRGAATVVCVGGPEASVQASMPEATTAKAISFFIQQPPKLRNTPETPCQTAWLSGGRSSTDISGAINYPDARR
jgi:hypothetical protein